MTMNSAQLRTWLEGLVDTWHSASHPSVPIFYENAAMPDEKAAPAVWIDVEIRYAGADEVTVGARPRGRETGALWLRVFTRAGEGTQTASAILDTATEFFRTNRRNSDAFLRFPIHQPPLPAPGWHRSALLIPFVNDQT